MFGFGVPRGTTTQVRVGGFDKRSSAASTDHGVMVVAGTSRKMWNTEKTSRNVLAPYCKITMVIPTSQNTINNLVNSPP